jgi:hypothetical protein
MRAVAFAAGLSLLGGLGCVQVPMGDRLCADPPSPCACGAGERDPSRGAVVVRWRLADTQVGTVLPRRACCCIADGQPLSDKAAAQCPNFGSKCPDTPAWLVRNVQLSIKELSGNFGPCVISQPCSTGELTTEYCLPEGEYDLRLTADIEIYDPGCREFVCSGKQTISPATFRRQITAGRATSLDGVVLGVNAPALYSGTGVGAGLSQCLPTGDGGTGDLSR